MLHKNATPAERHAPWSWEFSDSTARLLAADFVEQDVGKLALDKDTKQAWILASTTPTWVPMGSGDEVAMELEAHATAPDPHPQYAKADDARLSDPRTPTAHSHSFSDVTGLQTALDGKQDALVSGTNIKTINGESLIGPGDITVSGGGGGGVTLTGNLTLYATQSTTLTITNYDSATTYTVSATGGTATITGDQITYTAGGAAGAYAITVNGRAVPVTVEAASSIGTQGGQGFGVGTCVNQSILVARGLSAMTGTTDKAHANYGNYQHTNGSIVCYVPKFFYRIGHASSPRYGTYGANAHDIVGIEAYADEAAANAAGYALHRAFINADIEVDGFFIDKYLASKDGTSSCKSVANATPISLTASASYTNSNGMTGCTGILADAVVLARARGAGWNCASAFMQDAVAMLSLAHGQAATSTTYCAWYDAARTTNFPKGCNNGALADTNDATVTYTSGGDSGNANKPKTRATANFAKTTHNGQECGIADINGSMLQALIGLTMAGTIATDATQNTTGNAYILKRSADFAALTGGFGGTNDAWGTTSSLATNFDLINGFEPWLGATGWIHYGNGSNAVFSNATSGTDYLRKCSGIPLLTGTSAAGTSQFGNDGCYKYGIANQVPLASGLWNSAAHAGAFCRVWDVRRSYSGDGSGFRCAAY